MKKFLAVLLSAAMVLSVAACGSSTTETTETEGEETTETAGIAASDIKVGFIFIGDENEGYTYAHYEGALKMQEELGLTDDQIIYKWNTPEDENCYDAAVDLAEQGCDIIFANSFSHLIDDFINLAITLKLALDGNSFTNAVSTILVNIVFDKRVDLV